MHGWAYAMKLVLRLWISQTDRQNHCGLLRSFSPHARYAVPYGQTPEVGTGPLLVYKK